MNKNLCKNIDYKWVVLVLCFLMEFLCLGFCSSNVGLYTKAVTEAMQIKRSVYSLTSSIRYVVQVITALYLGTFVKRFGAKKMACVGLCSLTGSVLIRAFATEVYHLYIGGVFWGFGIVFAGNTMASLIVRRWFQQNVGRYTGIIMSANGIGGAIAAQIVTPIINNGETFGYRKSYLVSAAFAFAITVVIMLFLREGPEGDSEQEGVGRKKKSRGNMWAGIPYEELRKKPYFYATAVLVFLTGLSLHSIGNISLVYMADIGLSAEFVAATATVSSFCLTFTKILVGTAYDKKGLGFTLLMCQCAALTAFLLQANLTDTMAGMVMAIIATVLSSFATPMETVMVSLITNDLFGSASYSKVLGIIMAMNSLGLCLGSPVCDLYFDAYGTYKPCFLFFTFLLVVVAVGYRFVIRAAQKERE